VPVFTKKGAVEGFFEVSSGASGPVPPVDADAGFASHAPESPPGMGGAKASTSRPSPRRSPARKDAADRIVPPWRRTSSPCSARPSRRCPARAGREPLRGIRPAARGGKNKLMPPGAFLPARERFGLLPRLDRWVIQHIIGWASHRAPTAAWSPDSIFFVNVARATLCDPAFPEFVQKQLRAGDVPGKSLCFEK